MTQNRQLSLPFPWPCRAQSWPNHLGFDLYGLEFWTDARGVRDLRTYTYGVGSNWVAALADWLTHPKPID